jgi:phosphatidylserine decarboxylase
MSTTLKILKILPKNHLSYWAGRLMHVKLPGPLSGLSIRAFAKAYDINVEEAEKPLAEYTSIGDFFVRKLKPGLRPIAKAKLVHPADALLTQLAYVNQGELIQAKGKNYSVRELLQEPQDSALVKEFAKGAYAVYYLCPTDYHRVHSPVSGRIVSVKWIPGLLWPVNADSVESIPELFAVNERVVVTIETEEGLCSVIFVGATNVGKITLSFEAEIVTNNLKQKESLTKNYNPPLSIKAGDELGQFHMGSTVVMLCDARLAKHWPMSKALDWIELPTKMGGSFI